MRMRIKYRGHYGAYLNVISVFLVVVRFIFLSELPLMDKTEARYAEIARLMVKSQEWIVLQIEPGVPFWAKPPLSTWLSALSFQMFGISEFAARLPSFLLHMVVIIALIFWGNRRQNQFFLPAFVLLTTPEFLVHSGVVSTDTVLGLCIAGVIMSFWKTMQKGAPFYWKILLFTFLGLGLLAKGPIVFVLTVPPIIVWSLIFKIKLLEVMKRIQFLPGILLTTLIALPWYALAELKSPGFIDYFLIGEHFQRYLNPGWHGDLYGVPHTQVRGTIWLYMALFAFPWIFLVFIKAWNLRTTILEDKWATLLFLWLLWTPLFFTFSTSIVHSYILPSMIPMALLTVHWWPQISKKTRWIALASIFPISIFMASIFYFSGNKDVIYLNSDKHLIEQTQSRPLAQNIPVVYWKKQSYYGQFYSEATAQLIDNLDSLDSLFLKGNECFLLIQKKHEVDIRRRYGSQINLVDSNGRTSLYLVSTKNP